MLAGRVAGRGLCREGRGKGLYRDALAIACAADGDEMPEKPEFDEDELRLVLCFTVTRLGALAGLELVTIPTASWSSVFSP